MGLAREFYIHIILLFTIFILNLYYIFKNKPITLIDFCHPRVHICVIITFCIKFYVLRYFYISKIANFEYQKESLYVFV